jgi:hypothetical protein
MAGSFGVIQGFLDLGIKFTPFLIDSLLPNHFILSVSTYPLFAGVLLMVAGFYASASLVSGQNPSQ